MATFTAVNKVDRADTHMRVTWLLIGGLFILRTPLYGGIPLTGAFPDWLDPVWGIGTYLLTAILIWWERERLSEFHIDKLVLFLFVSGKLVELLLYQPGMLYSSIANRAVYMLYLPIAIGLVIALWRTPPRLPKQSVMSWVWIGIGGIAGIALAAYFATIFRIASPEFGKMTPTPTNLIFTPLWQMAFAGLGEEPLFRGFLWGGLRKIGLKEVWIWLLQAALFSLSHLSTLLYMPIAFWLIVPVGGLVLGLIAWQSRSIAPSIVAHSLANGLSQFM